MDGKPRSFEDHTPIDDEDDVVSRRLAALPPYPGLPSTPEEIAASDARAWADYDAGRYHSHAVVGAWLKTWGTADRKPFQEWLATHNA